MNDLNYQDVQDFYLFEESLEKIVEETYRSIIDPSWDDETAQRVWDLFAEKVRTMERSYVAEVKP